MNGIISILGQVVGDNALHSEGRIIYCWKNAVYEAVKPQPLDLRKYQGQVIEVSGHLHSDLWQASFIREVHTQRYQEITGKVTGFNTIEVPDGNVTCYRHGMVEAWYSPLILTEYLGKTITVAGDLNNGTLYHAQIIKVPAPTTGRDLSKEAKSLNDLMKIRADNREKIEAVNGNLGTALGYKWTNNQKTDIRCIIIFVPKKTVPWLIPDEELAPDMLVANDGTWCLTDVVTGGKAESLDEFAPLPDLSIENQQVVSELRSGRVGLIGGIQLAFFGDGIEDNEHSFVGTAGIAVRNTQTDRVGFLTNQHVADFPGRRIYHPWHKYFRIGLTYSTIQYEYDENWYNNVIDEQNSYVRCDCGFVVVDDYLSGYVQSGLHAIGVTGPLLRIDPDTMDIIGQKVISVGRTRGIQRGTIAAYAYEFDDTSVSIYTDLLIIGEEGKAFSAKGDSGKIIVTDDDVHRPVALLWGGWQERLRKGREQENWSYAIDLSKVLDRLNIELLT